MKIAYINTYGNGSTGKIVDSLKCLAQKKGYEVRSYFAREYCATLNTSKRFFSKTGFYFDALMTRLFDKHGLNNKHNTKKVINDLKRYNPDIVHIHNLHGYWINYPLLFKYLKSTKAKIIITLHDCWFFTGHCTYFDYVGCDKWITKCYSCQQKNQYPKTKLFDGSKANYREKKKVFSSLNSKQLTLVTPSKWLKGKVEKSFLNKFECVVINNGVNVDVFKKNQSMIRQRFGLENKIIVLSVASYWDERKGLKYILEAAKLRPEWCFVYIGKEKNHYGKLENVVHIDRTESQEELAMWYSTADVFINTTLEDNYPTTNLEAIACGTPVVTFDTGGSPEIVDETGFGLICEGKTALSLVNNVERCIINKIKNKESEIDKSKICDKTKFELYMDLYNKIEQ
ncbi:MAG: glycosyltransferase [Clostridia bacterium]|nr:glycosyltransferase [Clostridia bacterium]